MPCSALIEPPNALETDLCERPFKWVAARHDDVKKDVKKLLPKEEFHRVFHRSPDDGDGCALACAPDYVFDREPASYTPSVGGQRPALASIKIR